MLLNSSSVNAGSLPHILKTLPENDSKLSGVGDCWSLVMIPGDE